MAACESFQTIFEKPLPENPTLLQSLSSWKQIKSTKPIPDSSFTELFGELHFREYPESQSSSGNSFSSMNSESLQLCTEGLGSESSDDVENLKTDWQSQEQRTSITKPENLSTELRRTRTGGAEFPPPISCIGKSGKPWVCFKSYRQDGRFLLKEIRIPTQDCLQARREDGRLKLQFLQPEDEIPEEEEDENEEEEEEEDHDHHDCENCEINVKEEEQNGEDSKLP
ncbi:protein FANTASTIC FOUR 3-like [Diospyros lotus]|uniref:protein FANTASTIC FOUR 3-like n=1 Tax=Diospyros lotus TaxID=55363 RepID=UPI00225A4F58|nr:protein FANTASTIC FOUR 3-like [Diospyros lotus]